MINEEWNFKASGLPCVVEPLLGADDELPDEDFVGELVAILKHVFCQILIANRTDKDHWTGSLISYPSVSASVCVSKSNQNICKIFGRNSVDWQIEKFVSTCQNLFKNAKEISQIL